MDNPNDNIFEAGTSGPASESAKPNVGNPAANDGIEGRIDPVAARAATGGGEPSSGGNGGGNSPATNTPGGGEPVKRGRGRHPGGCNCPGCVAKRGAVAAETPAPKPDRINSKRAVKASFVERMLYSVHLGVAAVTKCPEFKLDKDDAKELGDAVAGVLAFHNIVMSPKQEAYSALMEAAVKVYPPMVVAAYFRKKAEAEGKGKVLKWPGKTGAGTPQPRAVTPPAAETAAPPARETILPPGFDPVGIRLDDAPRG